MTRTEIEKALAPLVLLPYAALAGGGFYALCVVLTGREPLWLFVGPWLATEGRVLAGLSALDPASLLGVLSVWTTVAFAVSGLIACACLRVIFAIQDARERRRDG